MTHYWGECLTAHNSIFLFFFSCWQPVEVVEKKEREKRRERNGEREKRK